MATVGHCWRCTRPLDDVLACRACAAPQPLGAEVDAFAVLGLGRALVVDGSDLERRYHEASRAVHPDRHQLDDPRAGELAVAASAAVNRAYRTLRDPIARGRYWLELHGDALGRANNVVPPALAALVFETQESLESLRTTPHDTRVRREVTDAQAALAERLQALKASLTAAYATWNGSAAAPATLADLKARLSEIAYLDTLAANVEAALDA